MRFHLKGVAAINAAISMENGDIAKTFAEFNRTTGIRIASYQKTKSGN